MQHEQTYLYQSVREFMLEIMAVMWAHGRTQLHVGGIMRLLGVPEDQAQLHDNDRIDITENFQELAQSIRLKQLLQSTRPAETTIH